jgi:hypothetical protein
MQRKAATEDRYRRKRDEKNGQGIRKMKIAEL